jgi:hypothetical protein
MAKESIISELAGEFISGNEGRIVDPITFSEAPWGFGLTLRPAQRVVIKALYGMPMDDVEKFPIYDVVKDRVIGQFTEKTLMKWLYETKRCNYPDTPDRPIKELVLVAGRRSGKSLVAACVIGYELYKLVLLGNPSKHYGKPEQASIKVLNVAPTDEQAAIVYDATLTAIDHCPVLKNRISNRTQGYFNLFSDEDIRRGKNKASLSFITGGCSSDGLRGHDTIVCCFDEMGFFISNEASKFSGTEIYSALTPSVKGFAGDGKILCLSSPRAKYGKFYEQYEIGMSEKDSSTLVFQVYSAMMNPDMLTSDDLKTDRRRNRNKFASEFGGEFSENICAWIDDPDEFLECVDKDFSPPSRGKSDIRYYAGLDLGFKNDGTALCIVHDEDGIIILDYAKVWFSGASDVWTYEQSIYANCTKYKHRDRIRMEDIAEEIIRVHKRFPIVNGMMDQREGYGMLEILKQNEIGFFESVPSTTNLNSDIYDILKSLYADRLLKLYNDPVLIPELMSLESMVTQGIKYKAVVESPDRTGCHDDLSEAFARAVYLCYNDKKRSAKRQGCRPLRGMGKYYLQHRMGNTERTTATMMNRRFF